MRSDEEETLELLFSDIIKLHRKKSRDYFGSLGIHRGQPAILFRLWERDGLAQKDIALALGSTPATVTIMLRRMEKTGLVERRPNPDDRRSSLVFLTERGRAIREEVVKAKHELNAACFRGFTANERELIGGYFRRIIRNLEPLAVAAAKRPL